MNLVQLQALLTGNFIPPTQMAYEQVDGFKIPESGGALKRRRGHQQQRFIHPGFSDGSRGRRKKKQKQKYASVMEQRRHELDVYPHIGHKRSWDREEELQLQKGKVEEFLAKAPSIYGKAPQYGFSTPKKTEISWRMRRKLPHHL